MVLSNQPDDDREPVCRTTVGFPCVDGPLVGEFHQRGESFAPESSQGGLKDGTYRLVGRVYVWEAG